MRRRTKWSRNYGTCRSSRPRTTHHLEDYLTLTKIRNQHPSRRTLGQTRYNLSNLGKRKNHDSKIQNPPERDTARRSPCNNYRRTRTRTAPLSDKKIRSDQNTPNSRVTCHTSRINPARSNCRNRRFVCNRGQARRSRSRNGRRRKTSNSKSNPWVAFLTARGAFPTPPARRRKATRAACGDSAQRVCPLRASSWGGPRRTCTPARPPPRRKT